MNVQRTNTIAMLMGIVPTTKGVSPVIALLVTLGTGHIAQVRTVFIVG